MNNQTQKVSKPVCPECGKVLEIESYHKCGNQIIVLCHCEECVDGIDSDWEGIYTKDEGYKDFTRYFFG